MKNKHKKKHCYKKVFKWMAAKKQRWAWKMWWKHGVRKCKGKKKKWQKKKCWKKLVKAAKFWHKVLHKHKKKKKNWHKTLKKMWKGVHKLKHHCKSKKGKHAKKCWKKYWHVKYHVGVLAVKYHLNACKKKKKYSLKRKNCYKKVFKWMAAKKQKWMWKMWGKHGIRKCKWKKKKW
jgi:hypothetical protein